MFPADDLAGEPSSEFVCTDAPPVCDDPNGTPAWQRALALGRRVREHRAHQTPKTAPAPLRVRTARPRGAGRPRARARRTTSSRAGPSDDPGEPEPGPRSGQPLLFIVHERYGKVSRALAHHLRELGL